MSSMLFGLLGGDRISNGGESRSWEGEQEVGHRNSYLLDETLQRKLLLYVLSGHVLVHEFMSIYYALAGWSGNRERRDERTKRKREKEKDKNPSSGDGLLQPFLHVLSLPVVCRSFPAISIIPSARLLFGLPILLPDSPFHCVVHLLSVKHVN
ncbi:hypothetical protein EVAR_71431_1 [Eumeta japonica]|uniref:Uncharacterized protein n=1 Tax=Eumeta variegata TaxID=151549 RepID=A0A4C1SI27_EUMVA|nr:hypothetical protein EVAR_71431_1 [Eumeta japonica]